MGKKKELAKQENLAKTQRPRRNKTGKQDENVEHKTRREESETVEKITEECTKIETNLCKEGDKDLIEKEEEIQNSDGNKRASRKRNGKKNENEDKQNGSKGNKDKSPDVKTDGEDVKTKLGTENQKKEEDISKTRRKRACTEKMEILKAAVTPPKKAKKSTEEMSPSKGPSVDDPKETRDKRSK